MEMPTITQSQVVAAMLRLIADQLVKLAASLEAEAAPVATGRAKNRTPAEWLAHLRGKSNGKR